MRQGRSLNALALAIEPIELTRKPRAFGRILCRKKIDPEGGTADPAAGVYPRAQEEAEVPALPGVMTYGDTEAQARAKVKVLALRVIADRLENGEPLPREIAG